MVLTGGCKQTVCRVTTRRRYLRRARRSLHLVTSAVKGDGRLKRVLGRPLLTGSIGGSAVGGLFTSGIRPVILRFYCIIVSGNHVTSFTTVTSICTGLTRRKVNVRRTIMASTFPLAGSRISTLGTGLTRVAKDGVVVGRGMSTSLVNKFAIQVKSHLVSKSMTHRLTTLHSRVVRES